MDIMYKVKHHISVLSDPINESEHDIKDGYFINEEDAIRFCKSKVGSKAKEYVLTQPNGNLLCKEYRKFNEKKRLLIRYQIFECSYYDAAMDLMSSLNKISQKKQLR